MASIYRENEPLTLHRTGLHFEHGKSCRRTETDIAMWLQTRYKFSVSKTTTIRARIEPDLKTEVESILGKLGLTASETIHLLYRQIKLRRGLPFEVKIPTPLTAKVLEESKAGKNVKQFASKRELYADLGL